MAPLPLPELSKRFLTRVGLPAREVVPGAVFDEVRRLPTPRGYYPEAHFSFDGAWDQTRLLGAQDGVATYMNLADGGSVWQLVPDRPPTILFVNSSVQLLGRFLAEFAQPSPGGSERWSRQNLDVAEARLLLLDPPAFEDAQHNYWPLIFEDVRRFW